MKNYFKIHDGDKFKVVKSDYYGEYTSSRLLSFDVIKSFDDGCLVEAYDFFHRLEDKYLFNVSRSINRTSDRIIGDKIQQLYSFDLYVPLIKHNISWSQDNIGKVNKSIKDYDKLPIAFTDSQFEKLVNKLKVELDGFKYK